MIAVLTGGSVIGVGALLSGCKENTTVGGLVFEADDPAFLDEVAETIIPTTNTPGAKAAKVGQFMTVMVNDCYEADDQRVFHEGMDKLEEASRKKFSKDFLELSAQEKHALLVDVDKEAKEYQKKKSEHDNKENEKEKEAKAKGNNDYKRARMDPHYFTMMKQLTLLGYFTSEVGATQALRYSAVPGKYEGCVPYKKGDKAWA